MKKWNFVWNTKGEAAPLGYFDFMNFWDEK